MTASILTRRALGVGVSRSAMAMAGLLIATGAQAQTAPPAPPPATDAAPEGDEIVVTGVRASLQSALNTKRNSAQVLDAISAEDIGKFPDKNIGEALQRVTGVQINRSSGEGQGVTIRGADPSLNRVEINGQTALSTQVGGGRGVDFRDLPAEFVSRLEVVKSATADMTEGGLGGTVRVITRRPFDSKEGFLAGSAQAVYGDLADKFDPKFALIGSKLFAGDTIGVLLSATYEDRSLRTDQARTTGWRQIDRDTATPGLQALDLNADGKGDFYPDIPRIIINREDTERVAFNGIVEYRPMDDLRVFAEGTYSKGIQTINSQFLQLGTVQNVPNGGVAIGSAVIGPDDTVTRVTFNGVVAAPGGLNVNYRNILGTINRRTFNGQIGSDWTVSDRFTINARGGYAKSRAYNNEINATAAATGLSSLTIDYDNDQQAPNITLPIDPRTTEGVNQLTVLRRPRYNNQTEYNAKLDAEYKPDGFLTSIKGGVERRVLTADSEYYDSTKVLNGVNGQTTINNYRTGVSQTTVASTTTPAALTAQLRDIISANSDLGDHDFFKTGDLGFTGIRRWLNLGPAVADAVGVPDPFTNFVPLDSWKVSDKNLAGYGQASFKVDLGFPVSGVIGARVVNTKTVSTGNQVVAGVVTPVRFTGEYTEFLPSINLKGEIIPDTLLARVTATEVLARPSPTQLAPRFTLDIVGLTGSRGNPQLQPFRARQYDAGLEYYINRTSYVSATYFRKEISSFIINTTQPEVVDGVTYTVTLPVNGDEKVTINGAEVGGQFAFDFLPAPFNGLGAIANYTFSKDSGYRGVDLFTGSSLPFPGLSRHSYNLSSYFENDLVSIRASYNWRSKFLITPIGRGNNPEFGEEFGQWDASASLNVTPKVSFFVEGVNIFNADRYENANSVYRRTIVETYGRRIYAGIRARL